MNITLDGDEGVAWEIDENRVTTRSESTEAVYRLPKRSPRVVLTRTRDGRSRLLVGGFTRAAITVEGPTDAIRRLREAVL